MNIKIISNHFDNTPSVFIGKTGMLRIKNKFTNSFGLKKELRWVIGVDEDDESTNRNIYLIKVEKDNFLSGKKMTQVNNAWSLDIKKELYELKIKIPIRCKVEQFTEKSLEGLKIKIS